MVNGQRSFALGLHVLAIAIAPIAIGGVHTESAIALAALLAVALGIQLLWRARRKVGVHVTGCGLWLLAASVVVGLQLVPLPPSLLETLSPAAAELRLGAAEVASVEGGWAPSSLSPAATARDFVRILAALAMLIGVAGLVRVRRGSSRVVLVALASTALATVVIAFVQQLLSAESILGFYEPRQTQGHRFFWSTFVNQNHFAALLCLAAPIALGLALDEQTERPRASLFFGIFVALVVAVFLTLSRSGMVALAVGLGLFGVVYALRRRKARHGRRNPLRKRGVGWGAAVVVSFALGGVVLFLIWPQLVEQWRQLGGQAPGVGDYPKFALYPDVWHMTLAHPWTGIGSGAFREVFPVYNADFPDQLFYYVENFALQMVADGGLVLGGTLLLSGLVLIGWTLIRAARSLPLLGASAGLTALCLQNLADFSLAMPGVMLPAAAVLGVLAGETRKQAWGREGTDEIRKKEGDRRGSSILAIAGLVVGVACLFPSGAAALRHDADGVRERVAAGAAGAVAEAAWWHPADAVSATAAGQRAHLNGERRDALRWLERAQHLDPRGFWPAIHTLRVAISYGDVERSKQALAVLCRHHWNRRTTRRQVLNLLRGHERAGELLGSAVDWEPERLEGAAKDLRALGALGTAERVLRAGLEHAIDQPELMYALADLYLSAHREEEANRVATRLLALHPDTAHAFLMQGDLATAAGDDKLAEHMYREAVLLAPAEPLPLFRQARALIVLQAWGPLESVFRQLRPLLETSRERAALLDLRCQAAERRGELREALRFSRAADRELPNHVPYLKRLAALLEKLERADTARLVYERVLELSPGDAQAQREVTRLGNGETGTQ